MSNMLQTGAQWLADQQKSFCSELVTVAVPNGATIANVSAVIGQTVFKIEDKSRFRLDWQTLDFLIQVLDLPGVVNYRGEVPKHTRITRADGSVWEAEPVNGEPCSRWSDRFKLRVRIHAKRVG